jgi:hypothetical protein
MNAIKKHPRLATHDPRTSSPTGKNQVPNDLENFDFPCRAQLDLGRYPCAELRDAVALSRAPVGIVKGAVATLDLGASGHCADDMSDLLERRHACFPVGLGDPDILR